MGEGRDDVCIVEAAEFGIAIEPCHEALWAVWDVVGAALADVVAAISELFSA